MSTPIKTDLFSFVTLRTPQLIGEERKELGFIFHPDASSSNFLNKVTDTTNIDQARDEVRAELGNFSPLTTYLDVKAIDQDLYKFSAWLMDNRKTVTKAEADAKAVGINSLNASNLLLLWDNLYYQALTKESSYVRQACIQMIIADNFIKKLNDSGIEDAAIACVTAPCDPLPPEGEERLNLYVQRLANAKVVMDKVFTNPKAVIQDTGLGNKDFSALDQAERAFLAENRMAKLTGAKEELEKLELTYTREYQTAEKAALEAHEATVKQLIDDAMETAKDNTDTSTGALDPAVANPKTTDSVMVSENGMEVDLPEFEFEFDALLSDNYLNGRVSDDTKALVDDLSLALYADTAAAMQVLDEAIATEQDLIFNEVSASNRILVSNGNVIRKSDSSNKYCFKLPSLDIIGPSGNINRLVSMNLVLEDPSITVTAAEYSFTLDSNAPITGTDFEVTPNTLTPGIVDIKFFNGLAIDHGLGSPYTFSGTLTLSNGVRLGFEVSAISAPKQGGVKGCARILIGDGNGDGPIEDPTVQLFGINRVGIADFRRVEQEVSCYVAGDVSHIENIMAREFKDKATRKLISSETTTETTTEVEVENLSETTTSERNELQTEVSSVINEDQSQAAGATTGVNGTFPSGSYSASAFADFASSTSTSDSNSTSQTYAQEVTERALERVVKKTTEKRTSRILREFEENNRHGFDNREGADHVAGIYRWVDKIYNNKLINYGKRLMYEFMVPEPANFFKKVIDAQIEKNDQINLLDQPIHPSELTGGLAISSARDLDATNYQRVAAFYNAEVNAAPDMEITVGDSITIGPGNTSTGTEVDTYSLASTVAIPQGYEAKQARAIYNAVSNGLNTNGRLLSITVGDQTKRLIIPFRAEILELGSNTSLVSIKRYREEVPVSCTLGNHASGDISVSIICELTTEAKAQWQNETYKAILDAYEAKLQAFNDSQLLVDAENSSSDAAPIRFNPLFNRAIEKREIKRMCIEMLAKPFNRKVGESHLVDNGGPALNVKQDQNFENYASQVKFFEQAFDWEIMAYLFYSYYWANEGQWIDLFQSQDAADPIFQAFLQSGMARIVVPVRPGFEDAVGYYVETGDIWNGGDLVVDHDDDLYISIAEEMQTVEGVVEKEWETRVPTALTIIQDGGGALDDNGLPCFKEGANKIGTGDNTLAGSSQGVGSFVVS